MASLPPRDAPETKDSFLREFYDDVDTVFRMESVESTPIKCSLVRSATFIYIVPDIFKTFFCQKKESQCVEHESRMNLSRVEVVGRRGPSKGRACVGG